jgi:hypothetical protein
MIIDGAPGWTGTGQSERLVVGVTDAPRPQRPKMLAREVVCEETD